ncbi:MAG: c-type cytochrome [Pyrinomonadaceae bacterium]
MRSIKTFVIISAFVLFAMSCSKSENTNTNSNANENAAATPTATEQTKDDIAGKELYAQNCTKCHKEDGKGGEMDLEGKKIKPSDLTSERAKLRSDDKFVEGIQKGHPEDGMPAFQDKLSEAQIKEIVRYIRDDLQKS